MTQSRNRSQDHIPSVDEFILMRRATIGGAMVEGTFLCLRITSMTNASFSNDRIFIGFGSTR